MKNGILLYLVFTCLGSGKLFAQADTNPLDGTEQLFWDQNPNKTLSCGRAYIYMVEIEKTSSIQADKAEFLKTILAKGREKIEKKGFKCMECDDPAATGCDLTVQLIYEKELVITETTENGNKIFTMDTQDVGFRISCSLCNMDQKEVKAAPEGQSSASGKPQAASDYHSLLEQTKCNETGYFSASIQGMVFTKGTTDEAFEAMIKMVEENHSHFGFGCKLCPDGTRRCEVNVTNIYHNPGVRTLMPEHLKMDSTSVGITIPTQEIIIVYDCLDCPVKKEESVNPTAPEDKDGDAVPDAAESVAYPWSVISLTDVRMKPFYVAPVPVKPSSAALPLVSGILGVGSLAFVIFQTEKSDEGCDFTASSVVSPATCGLANGAISITTQPPSGYTYVWSNGDTTMNLQNIVAGNYSVTVSRVGTTCTQVVNASVSNDIPVIDATITSQDADCGQSNGSATVSVNPAGFYTYLWSNGSTDQNQSGLAAGSYSVTVSAGGSCENSFPVEIGTVPFDPNITFSTTSSGCGLADGTATINIDPTGTYDITWSNGQTGSQATDLAAGTYTVTVSVPGSVCMKSSEVTIGDLPPSFTISVTSTPSGCGMADGTATAIAEPAGEYTYAWSNGGTGAQLTGLIPGNYTVTVSIPGSTCSQEASVTVDELPPSFTVSVTSTASGCGLSDGTATAIVDPAGEYTYAWSNGSTGTQLTGLIPGNYTVTVSIPGTTCLQTASVTVDELPAAFSLSFTTTPAGCGITNGSATVIVDPAGAYTYLWSDGSTDPVLSNVGPGEYSVTVTIPGSMCSNTASVVVEQAGGGFTATFITENADCGLASGTATITVDPAAEYTYLWSNQQTGPILQQVITGTYTVVVTDMNSCTEEFSVTIDQDPAEYITVDNTSPGNCDGGGDITFTLTTPGTGPLNVQVEGPQGAMPLSLSPGTYQLSSFIPVLPGTYTFTVYDEQIGNTCIEVVSATVQDNTPPLIVTDDFYTTPAGQALFENALENDSGLNIEMTAVGDVFGGAVTFNASGDFTFIPEPGFNGDASFTYTVTDICGNTSTGVVTILVEQVNCDFDVTFQVTPASCGLEDGMITAVVSPPGSYSFIWNTGDTGPTINNVASGPYSVTITDNNLGCDLDFATNVPENPAEYISDIVITQPTCSDPGEIQFTATSNTPGELVMNVIHPNGLDIFFIDPGVVRLSDFISITPGDYTVEIIDPEAGTDCFDFFEATLNPTQMLEIVTEDVFPPSEPTAMDGSAIIVVIVPGVLPYTVLVNEVPYQTANSNTIQINGLGVGEYLVQIIDATGCMSNILLVIIPFPDIILSYGTGISNVSYDVANEQPNVPSTVDEWRNGLWISVKYPVKGLRQELHMMYMTPQTSVGKANAPGILQLEHLTDIKRMHWKKIQFGLQGGIGMRYMNQDDQFLVPDPLKQYWTIQSSAGFSVAKKLRWQGNFSVQGWSKIERPIVEISFNLRP